MINKNKKVVNFLYLTLIVIISITMLFVLPSNKDYLLTNVNGVNNNYNLKIVAIDYGADTYGDTVLLESQGKYLLMDTGGRINDREDKALYLINYLEKNNVYNFDSYISHYDQDHFYYIKYLLDNSKFKIGTVYLPEIKKIREQCANFESKYKDYFQNDCANYSMLLHNMCSVSYGRGATKATIHDLYSVDSSKKCYKFNKNMDIGDNYVGGYFHNYAPKKYSQVKFKYITKGDSINIGKARLDVIWHRIPDDVMGEYKKYDNLKFYKEGNGAYSSRFANNSSLVSMVTAGNKKYLTAGDIQYEVEQDLIREVNNGNLNLKADIMKLSHHGLGTSNYYDFLKTVKPTYAFYQISTAVESGPGFTESDKISYISVSSGDNIWSGRLYNAQNYIDTIFGTRYNGNVVFTLTDDDIKVDVERNYSKVKLYYNDVITGKRIKEKEFVVNNAANSLIDKSLRGYDFISCNEDIVRKKYNGNVSYACSYRSKKVDNEVKTNTEINKTTEVKKNTKENKKIENNKKEDNTNYINNKATIREENPTISTNNPITKKDNKEENRNTTKENVVENNNNVVAENNNTSNNTTVENSTNNTNDNNIVVENNNNTNNNIVENNSNNTIKSIKKDNNEKYKVSKITNKKNNNTDIFIEIVVIVLLIIIFIILCRKETEY